ncbi:MAG: hypothetical protein LBR90_03245 [Elusimicrobiota bacterium]|jgi:hypothetical protein|nr:hypothetical protein [Elusimicrobiota bacterium]
MSKKYLLFALLALPFLPLLSSAQNAPQEPQEYKLTVSGLAPVVTLQNTESVDIMALYVENGELTSATILKNKRALKAAAQGENSEITLLLSLEDRQFLDNFKSARPEARYSMLIRSPDDAGVFRTENSTLLKLIRNGV